MDGQVIMTNYDLDPGGGNGFYHHQHPELEHLAKTMPVNSFVGESNELNVRSQSRMSISHDKGLLNMPGQNNCFLNSAVQVLWHLDIFRRSFRELQGHACMGDSCIFCALKELFNQFQSSTESALPPDSLRFALAQAFSDQRRFRLGYMDDAAECFENILFRIHYHITNQELDSSCQCLQHCIPHQKFSMNLYEQIVCYSCGASSEPFIFSQMVYYISTSALCTMNANIQQMTNTNVDELAIHGTIEGDKAKFGYLLKKASSMGDIRNCPKMCGARINIRKILLNRPDIISIGLVWDTDHPSLTFIRNVYKLIEVNIHLNEIFDLNDVSDGEVDHHQKRKELNLVGLVTYYGKHYSTYIFNTKLSQWIYFDDATVRVVGPYWSQVVDKCIKGHFQPLLLLYSNPKASIINTKYATKDIVPMTILKKPDHQQPNDKGLITPNLINPPHSYISQTEIKQYSDVPDSPSATSTTSYFSDVGDSTDGYISRKTVENIIKIQQRSTNRKNKTNNTMFSYNNKKYNRSSTSSLDSFDSVVRQISTTNISKITTNNDTFCSLQRRDSGNSSGDRASSVSSNETPYYPQRRLLKQMFLRNPPPPKNVSDQGYDSFSLSSSDSYPSTTTSPSKLNCRLKQIPEDVQMSDNLPSMDECDKLCSEADILLLKSHAKEREGDLRAAVALSDSAAAKARLAMDIPYSNHQTLISAKMKHSMCVMRSASLHKRVLELEAEEKRLLKAAMEASHHSRQSSRDSSHGRHSRQSSRDSKDPKSTKENNKAPDQSKMSKDSTKLNWPSFNLEIYATLPKKVKNRKSHTKDLTTVHDENNSNNTTKANEFRIYENVTISQKQTRNTRPKMKNLISDSEFSDYCSEWEAIKKKHQKNKTDTNNNGWQSCRENESESYAEFGSLPKPTKKQCKIKRKLMFGNFLKTKNRSLPDLREEVLKDNKQEISKQPKKINETNNTRSTVANINSKGFHQSHKSFVAERGFKTKPLLIKVKPPLVEDNSLIKKLSNISINQNSDASNRASVIMPIDPCPEKLNNLPKRNNFLEELNRKRSEILKYNNDDYPIKPLTTAPINKEHNQKILSPMLKKPNSFEIANFISKSTTSNIPVTHHHNELDSIDHKDRTANLQIPIPVNPMNIDGKYIPGNKLRHQKPPDYETTLKRIEMNITEKKKSIIPPPSSPIYSNLLTLNVIKADPAGLEPNINTNNHSKSAGHQIIHKNQQQTYRKKSVKFSDQIELVACADDETDLPLPNPLFEKVLGKNFLYNLQ